MKPETLGEAHILLQNLTSKMDELHSQIVENTKITNQVLVQATATNGRVNKIEPIVEDYKENRARIRGALTFGSIIITGVIAGIVMLGKLYIDKLQSDISANVTKTLETKYSIEIK